MQFRSEKQRRAVMAQIHNQGTVSRGASFWGKARNPFGSVNPSEGRRRSIGRAHSPAELAALGEKNQAKAAVIRHNKEATAALGVAGFTSGLGPKGMSELATVRHRRQQDRRAAFRQAAAVGGVTALAALPGGYLALRTGLGNRAALALARRARPLKAAESFLRYSGKRLGGTAEGAIVSGESRLRNYLTAKIDRGVTRFTGVDNITAELTHRMGGLKSRYLFAKSPEQRSRIIREMGGIQRRQSEVWTGPGALDRFDARFKRGVNRLGVRLGLPMTGSLQRSGSQLRVDPAAARELGLPTVDAVTGQGSWVRMVQRNAEVRKAWQTAVKKGRAEIDGTSMVRVRARNGDVVIRRRGGAPKVTPLGGGEKPTQIVSTSRGMVAVKKGGLAEIARQNELKLSGIKQRIPAMSQEELRRTLYDYPQLKGDVGKYIKPIGR